MRITFSMSSALWLIAGSPSATALCTRDHGDFLKHVGSHLSRILLLPILFCAASLSIPVHAETRAVVVQGLGGDERYTDSFAKSAQIIASAIRTLNPGQDKVRLLDDTATRDDVLAAIDAQAAEWRSSGDFNSTVPTNEAVFILVLVGHGTADGETWRFNQPGPDLTTEDIVAAMNSVPTTQQLIVLAASASGAALEVLDQPGRVLITATKSGGESNAVRFPEYLAEAMAADVADFDRNEILTIGEAYRQAVAATADYYDAQKLLASEHARYRGDDSDKIAVALLGSLKDARDDPRVSELLAERQLLENAFDELTGRKENMRQREFYQQLEVLLIDIAKLQQALDQATGWQENDADS